MQGAADWRRSETGSAEYSCIAKIEVDSVSVPVSATVLYNGVEMCFTALRQLLVLV